VSTREINRIWARRVLDGIGANLAREPNSGFYRPARRPNPVDNPRKCPCKPAAIDLQLSLNFEADQPLRDLIPEAYED